MTGREAFEKYLEKNGITWADTPELQHLKLGFLQGFRLGQGEERNRHSNFIQQDAAKIQAIKDIIYG